MIDGFGQPDARALIAECRRVLKEKLIPQTQGGVRYELLMIASALGMAERELIGQIEIMALLGAPAAISGHADAKALAAAIRAGRHDADGALHGALLAASTARTAVSKPAALDASEREGAATIIGLSST
ncbi:MAG: DUF6285 domain-containing protein [Bosea sp. (in: a-proteobacteria)]